MDKHELQEIAEKVGKEAAGQIEAEVKKVEAKLNAQYQEVTKGLMTEKSFEDFKKEAFEPLNKMLEAVDTATKAQGEKINSILEKAGKEGKTLEEFVADTMKEMREKRTFVTVTGAQLKAAGIQSIAGSVNPASPYLPGPAGDLQVFDIALNPNFITSKVDLGTTDRPILAWANEIGVQGAPTLVLEGDLKPQVSRSFKVEISTAVKVAGWSEFTEEFEQDLPGFGTKVRRMLQDDVIRAWDDNVQLFAQTKAHKYEISQLDGRIQDANFWDALLAMEAQVGYYNFQPNTIAINWLTNVIMKTLKNDNGTYLLPGFVDDLRQQTVYANKVPFEKALVGDLKQLHVDMYKDITLRIGWINDEFIHNKFAAVAELRYHQYISDNRTKALVFDALTDVATQIKGDAASF